MVENVEQIEARLAAYIDGELNPDERVELERHLDANPAHRALIRELSGHRDLLRMLPREHAPADLSQPLQGAMERDALLGGGDPLTEFKSVRARRWWPQLLAAAAIFVLAFGLAAIVFYVLPPKHPTVSIVQPPEPEGLREARIAREKSAEELPPLVSRNVELDAADVDERASDKGEVAELAMTPLLKESVEAAEPAARLSDTLVITITADNLQQASTDLLSYFSNNGITFSEVANPETLAKPAKVVTAEEHNVQLAMRDAADRESEDALRKLAAAPAPAGAGGGGATMRDTAVASPGQSLSGSARARRAAVRNEPAAVPATLPTAPQETQQREARDQTLAGAAAGVSGTDRYVVLASLNGTQAERLADTFGRPTLGRRAELRREPIALPVAAPAQRAPAAPRPLRGIQVGLGSTSKVADTPHDQVESFKLLTPATRPADPTALWALSEETLTAAAAPTTRPAEPFTFMLPKVESDLNAQVFNCVVVVRKPEAPPAPSMTQPTGVAAPTTRPTAP